MFAGDVPMYWNWVLDWAISDTIHHQNDVCGRCTYVLGLGHIRLDINKMLCVGDSWVIDKMDWTGFINEMF